MPRKSVILLALIVVLPIAALAWIGMRLERREREMQRQRVQNLLTERLVEIDEDIGAHFNALSNRFQTVTAIDEFDRDGLRELIRDDPSILQLFVLSPEGALVHPDPLSPLNRTEREFIVASTDWLQGGDLVTPSTPDESAGMPAELSSADDDSLLSGDFEVVKAPGPRSRFVRSKNLFRQSVDSDKTRQQATVAKPQLGERVADTAEAGWFVWYWGRGINLIYWQRRPSGFVVAVALERVRWMADLISVLPDTSTSTYAKSRSALATDSLFRLVDSSSEIVYQWGNFEPLEGATAFCEIPVSAPLAAWRLKYFVPDDQLLAGQGRSSLLNLAAGLITATLGLLGLSFYLYREYSRDMREASQRVSFVNQVSHELKTPLTNIRMYADLLERDLEALPIPSAEKPRTRLNVILSESRRLSRLIGNVLTFASQQRNTLRLRLRETCIDEVVRTVVERFQPSLEKLAITASTDLAAISPVLADADAVEQILGNLISNVEKYAGSGSSVQITTRQVNGTTTIAVSDSGPGIEGKLREKIFQPFSRASDGLERAAGTGIGLSIVRDLARLHGGDVRLLDNSPGATFEVRLETKPRTGVDRA